MRLAVLLIGLFSLLSSQVQAFDFYEWMRTWHVDVGSPTSSVRVTQPTNPVDLRVCPPRGGCTVYPLNVYNINGEAKTDFSVVGQIPLTKLGNTIVGLQIERQLLRGEGRGHAISLSAYTSHPIVGPIDGIAWAGSTTYQLLYGSRFSNGLWWTGNASAMNMGIGVKANMPGNLTLTASYETTQAATITDISYSDGKREIQLPLGYQDPPFTYLPSATLRVGIGLNASILPSRVEKNESRQLAQRNMLEYTLNENLPTVLRPFVTLLVSAIAQEIGNSTFTDVPPGSVLWDAAGSRLVMRMRPYIEYQRDADYITWADKRNVVDSIYPKLHIDLIDQLTKLVEHQVHMARSQGTQVSTKLLLEVVYRSYINPMRKDYYWDHMAHIELAIDKETGDTRVVSAKTDTIQGGFPVE